MYMFCLSQYLYYVWTDPLHVSSCTEYQLIAVAMTKIWTNMAANNDKKITPKTIQIVEIINYVSIQLIYINFISYI